MRKKAWVMVAATILIIAVSGCCTPEVRHEPVKLPQPTEPVYTAVTADDVACVSDTSYGRIVERDRQRKNYGEECAAIIDANNAGVKE